MTFKDHRKDLGLRIDRIVLVDCQEAPDDRPDSPAS